MRRWLLALLLAAALPAAICRGELRVFVMTMGPGPELYERFGHNALWVHDSADGSDIAYNWGIFSFDNDFISRFIRGDMRYWMEGFDARRTAEIYAAYGRSVSVMELDLSDAQKRHLQDFLLWNQLPENRYYRYDYIRDNCTTRLRDALDAPGVLHGQLRRQLSGIWTGESCRFYTRRIIAADALAYTGLEFILGRPVDQPLNAWDACYLPEQLEKYLRAAQGVDEGGVMHPLVKPDSVRLISPNRLEPVLQQPPNWLWRYLAIGVVYGLVSGTGIVWAAGSAKRWRARLALTPAVAWEILCGAAGTFWLGGVLFTDHWAIAWNDNGWLFTPLSWVLAWALLRGRGNTRWARGCAVALALPGMVLVLLKLSPLAMQANGPMLALALPIHLCVAAALVGPKRLAKARGA